MFKERETLKNYLYFRKRNFLIFQQRYIYFQNPGITELSYISGKEYSEPYHTQNQNYFQNLGIFRTRNIFRTLSNTFDGTFYKKQLPRALKKSSYISYSSGNGTFQLQYFRKRKPRKNSLYLFRKRNFLIFQEIETLKNFLYLGSNFPSSKNELKTHS